jgi:hypothetical protein
MLGFESEAVLIAAACIFLFAGFVKGVAGVGLPSIGMGLLTLTESPAKAAALLILPLLATNLWLFLAGPALRSLLRRLGWMMLFVCIGTWLTFGVIFSSASCCSAPIPRSKASGSARLRLIKRPDRLECGRRPSIPPRTPP